MSFPQAKTILTVPDVGVGPGLHDNQLLAGLGSNPVLHWRYDQGCPVGHLADPFAWVKMSSGIEETSISPELHILDLEEHDGN